MNELRDFIKSRSIVNLIIVALNILVFLIMEIGGDTENVGYMLEHGACFVPYVIENGEYYRLFTCMFMHFGLQHLMGNMLVLIFLGDTLECAVGKVRYLIIYIVGGLAGNLLSMYHSIQTQDFAVSAGASGAIFAVVGALIYVVAVNKGRLADITGKRLILMAALTLFQGLTSMGVDNSAHIGGLAAGLVLAVLLYRRKRPVPLHPPF